MNLRRMIDMLLTRLSVNHKVQYIESRTYIEDKVFKRYKVKIDDDKMEDFNSMQALLIFLKDWK